MSQWNVEICDVTLRDGEQTPGVTFNLEEKQRIAGTLDEIGIEVIEAGFPAVSENELSIVKSISKMGLSARICCLARAVQSDVDCAGSGSVCRRGLRLSLFGGRECAGRQNAGADTRALQESAPRKPGLLAGFLWCGGRIRCPWILGRTHREISFWD